LSFPPLPFTRVLMTSQPWRKRYPHGMDNRRSTTGYCAFLAGACVSHCSRRQKTPATSTAHAEYLAAFECGRGALRSRVLMADMGLPQKGPTTIFEDNEICIRMSETDTSTPRMQYLDARYHWLREAVVHAKTIHTLGSLLHHGDGSGRAHQTAGIVRD
jgi:hypothetical protein